MKKAGILTVALLIAAALMVGCTSSADTMPSASPSVLPTATTQPSPSVTVFPAATQTTQAGVTTLEDSKRAAQQLEEELGKLSELSTTYAVVAGSTAVVGATYDSAYQAGMTSRLTGMIEQRAQAVDASLTKVYATDDAALTEQIKKLRDQVEADEITFEQLTSKVEELVMAIERSGANGTGGTDATSTEAPSGGTAT